MSHHPTQAACAVYRTPLRFAYVVAFAVVAGLGAGASAQDPTTNDEMLEAPVKHARGFLEGLNVPVESDLPVVIEKRYAALLKDSPLERDAARIKKVVNDTKELFSKTQIYGKVRQDTGIETIKAQRIGRDLALLRFLYKFERLPVIWYFTYYRTGGNWVLISVRFDHEYELLGL